MVKWINAAMLAELLGGKKLYMEKVIAKGYYKKQPLIVRKEKNPKGKPTPLVLWNTTTNQPATQPEAGDHHATPNPTTLSPRSPTASQDSSDAGKRAGILPSGNAAPETAHPQHSEFGRIAGIYQELPVDGSDEFMACRALPNSTGNINPTTTLGDTDESLSLVKDVVLWMPSADVLSRPPLRISRNDTDQIPAPTAATYSPQPTIQRQAQTAHGVEISQGTVATLDPATATAQGDTTPHPAVVLETNALPTVAANIDLYPDGFSTQIDYVIHLIDHTHKLGKACRSTVLTQYFKTMLVADDLRADWTALTNNPERIAFAKAHCLVGIMPNRLKAEGNPKTVTGRKSAVPAEAVAWLIKTVHEWADDTAPVLTATRRRTVFLLQQFLKDDTGIVLSEKQITTLVKKHNLRHLMDKPQGKAGKKISREKGTYPRLPVNSLWLMDGCVPELMYIKGLDGRYTKITCIGIEDVGSRKLLGFREYYSESGESSVDLFKSVMTQNQFKKGASDSLIAPTLRPDKGSGFMTSMGACAFAIGKAYAERYRFAIDFKEANAGSPTEKAHLESFWKAVHSSYVGFVQNHFLKLGKIDKTPLVANHKRGIEMSALYLDITLEELRAAGMAEKFRAAMNASKERKFTEDGTERRFVPNDRWNRYLSGTALLTDDLKTKNKWARFIEELDEKAAIAQPPANSAFSADEQALELLNAFGYTKAERNIQPNMTLQHNKASYNISYELGFSTTRATPVRVSEMPDGRLAIFTAKEKKTKTKHDFGAEFIGFATAKAIGGNADKAKYIRNKKADKMADVLEMSKKDAAYSDLLKEIKPYLISFGTASDQQLLRTLVAIKLTPDLAKLSINELCIDKTTGNVTAIEFKRFAMEARKRLQNILILPTQNRNIR